MNLFLKSVQRHVGQDWRDDPALGCSGVRVMERVLVYETGFKPGSQGLGVHGDVRDQPVMADAVEACLDVSVEHPLGRRFLAQCDEELTHGIRS